MQRLHPETNTRLAVTSSAFQPGGAIPDKYSAYHQGVALPVSWSGAPGGTQSFALLIEDPDAPAPQPFVHWVVYDIPAGATSLPEGTGDAPTLDEPKGAHQGKNGRSTIGYFGMRPPETDPPHHYHVEVFALDRKLGLDPGATRDQLVEAMKGHVLAQGEVVGTYRKH